MNTIYKPRGHPPRLQNWDYSSAGAYFVTFVVKGKVRCLSTIENGKLQLIRWGEIVQDCWFELPSQFQSVILDEMVIMPNHVHAIVLLAGAGMDCEAFIYEGPKGALIHQGSTNQGPTLKPMMADSGIVLGKVIRAWKAKSALMIHKAGNLSFAWQSRYYEHIIRNELELERVRAYIVNNPVQWDVDVENPER
jgi:REP element-mobilizing transposase RayT